LSPKKKKPEREIRNFWNYSRAFKLGWIDAVTTAEEIGDTGPLVALLRSNKARWLPQADVHNLLAELLERRKLARKKGAQKTPIFGRTAQMQYDEAAEDVRAMTKGEYWNFHGKRLSRSKAIDIAADQRGLNAYTLQEHMFGKRFGGKAKPKKAKSKKGSARRSPMAHGPPLGQPQKEIGSIENPIIDQGFSSRTKPKGD
jgi:hypothetical protein